jgi:hypothetical protein
MGNSTASSDNLRSCLEAPLDELPPTPPTKKKKTASVNDISFLSRDTEGTSKRQRRYQLVLSYQNKSTSDSPTNIGQHETSRCSSHVGEKQRWIASDALWEQHENGRVDHGGRHFKTQGGLTQNDVRLLGTQRI